MCGCCCKKVGVVIEQGIEFPYKARENGECEMLENNKCKVYDNRPTICNIESIIKIRNLDREEYYKKNIEICNKMMDEYNMPQEYRIINNIIS
jgi:Fe-S-cluster containining protein